MLTSKVTSKGQITIPAEVREKLNIDAGDILACELINGGVRLRKVQPVDGKWHAAVSETLKDEWDSPEDEAAFRDLQ